MARLIRAIVVATDIVSAPIAACPLVATTAATVPIHAG